MSEYLTNLNKVHQNMMQANTLFLDNTAQYQ